MCHGYIGDGNFNPTLDQTKDVIDQILASVGQLSAAKKTHNDIKPTNLLYLKSPTGYDTKLSDFGQAGQMGGTPGWTAPVFHRQRQSGNEDIFSIGWVCLRLLCKSKELFLSLRDNYVEDINASWMTDFHGLVEIDFVNKLVNLNLTPTIEQVNDHWKRIRSSVQMIDIPRLVATGVPSNSLRLQLDRPR